MTKNWMGMIIVICFFLLGKSPHLFSQCGEMKKNFSHESLGEPTLLGEPDLVPTIRLRVTERATLKAVGGAKIYMRYVWRHFRLPYYEYQDGKWDKAYDVISCTTNNEGIVQFPEYNVVPRGWYNGDKLRNRLPEFLEIQVSYETYTFTLATNQLIKIREKSIRGPIELKRPDKFVPPIKIELVP